VTSSVGFHDAVLLPLTPVAVATAAGAAVSAVVVPSAIVTVPDSVTAPPV